MRPFAVAWLLLGFCAAVAARPEEGPQAPSASDPSQALIARTCVGCHNDRARSGNLSLESFDITTAGQHPGTTEKMIR